MRLYQGLRVMGIDPGEDTGLATHTTGNFVKDIFSWQDQYTHDQFLQQLNEYHPDIIVCESFDHRAKDNANYAPVEYIGMVKWYVERRDTILVFQTPSFGKAYFDNEKLKKLGLYVPGKDHVDQMMAVRHLLQFYMKNNAFDLRLLK